jgi:hypothetical protein
MCTTERKQSGDRTRRGQSFSSPQHYSHATRRCPKRSECRNEAAVEGNEESRTQRAALRSDRMPASPPPLIWPTRIAQKDLVLLYTWYDLPIVALSNHFPAIVLDPLRHRRL